MSTLIGSALDTALFFTIAFAGIDPNLPEGWANGLVPLLGWGPQVPLWQSLALADWSVKLAMALLALVPFRLLVRILLQSKRKLS